MSSPAETSLLTQDAVAAIDAEIAQLLAIAEALGAANAAAYNSLLSLINAHIAESYAVAHDGITAVGGTYLDNAGDTDGNYLISFVVNNTTYYAPASLSPSGVPQPPPPPPPPPPSGGGKSC
jgi:hypothetical protein